MEFSKIVELKSDFFEAVKRSSNLLLIIEFSKVTKIGKRDFERVKTELLNNNFRILENSVGSDEIISNGKRYIIEDGNYIKVDKQIVKQKIDRDYDYEATLYSETKSKIVNKKSVLEVRITRLRSIYMRYTDIYVELIETTYSEQNKPPKTKYEVKASVKDMQDFENKLRRLNSVVEELIKIINNTEVIYTISEKNTIVRDYNKILNNIDSSDVLKHGALVQARNLNLRDCVFGGLVKETEENQNTISLKAEGLRSNLFIHGSGIWLVFPPNFITRLTSSCSNCEKLSGTIFDGENIGLEGRRGNTVISKYYYLPFTPIATIGKNGIQDKPLKERLIARDKLIDFLNANILSRIKNILTLGKLEFKFLSSEPNETFKIFKELNDSAELLEFETDGMMITPNSVYNPKSHVHPLKDRILTKYEDVCKWKPWSKLTIDFIYNYPTVNSHPSIQSLDRVSGNLVEFSGTIENGFDLENIDLTHPLLKFDGSSKKIIEFGPIKSTNPNVKYMLVPIRERTDKSNPNSLEIAQDIWNSIHNPLTIEVLTGQTFSLVEQYHQSIKSELIESFPNNVTFFDNIDLDILENTKGKKTFFYMSTDLVERFMGDSEEKQLGPYTFIRSKNNKFIVVTLNDSIIEHYTISDSFDIANKEKFLSDNEKIFTSLFRYGTKTDIGKILTNKKNKIFPGEQKMRNIFTVRKELVPFFKDAELWVINALFNYFDIDTSKIKSREGFVKLLNYSYGDLETILREIYKKYDPEMAKDSTFESVLDDLDEDDPNFETIFNILYKHYVDKDAKTTTMWFSNRTLREINISSRRFNLSKISSYQEISNEDLAPPPSDETSLNVHPIETELNIMDYIPDLSKMSLNDFANDFSEEVVKKSFNKPVIPPPPSFEERKTLTTRSPPPLPESRQERRPLSQRQSPSKSSVLKESLLEPKEERRPLPQRQSPLKSSVLKESLPEPKEERRPLPQRQSPLKQLLPEPKEERRPLPQRQQREEKKEAESVQSKILKPPPSFKISKPIQSGKTHVELDIDEEPVIIEKQSSRFSTKSPEKRQLPTRSSGFDKEEKSLSVRSSKFGKEEHRPPLSLIKKPSPEEATISSAAGRLPRLKIGLSQPSIDENEITLLKKIDFEIFGMDVRGDFYSVEVPQDNNTFFHCILTMSGNEKYDKGSQSLKKDLADKLRRELVRYLVKNDPDYPDQERVKELFFEGKDPRDVMTSDEAEFDLNIFYFTLSGGNLYRKYPSLADIVTILDPVDEDENPLPTEDVKYDLMSYFGRMFLANFATVKNSKVVFNNDAQINDGPVFLFGENRGNFYPIGIKTEESDKLSLTFPNPPI